MLTFILIGVTVLVSWLAFDRPALLERLILWPPAIDRKKQYDRLLTHGFIHADWSHLLFNMITLYFFGRQIEVVMAKLIGPMGFVLFYLSAIVVAILPTYLRHRHDPHYRSLGASGRSGRGHGALDVDRHVTETLDRHDVLRLRVSQRPPIGIPDLSAQCAR